MFYFSEYVFFAYYTILYNIIYFYTKNYYNTFYNKILYVYDIFLTFFQTLNEEKGASSCENCSLHTRYSFIRRRIWLAVSSTALFETSITLHPILPTTLLK
jgi:hypothetical protein